MGPRAARAGGSSEQLAKVAAVALSAFGLSGCAVHWYDPETGIEHVLGVAHVRMRVAPPSEGLTAVATSVETVGVGVALTEQNRGVSVGYDASTRLTVIAADAALRVEWPTTELIDVRIGSAPPFAPEVVVPPEVLAPQSRPSAAAQAPQAPPAPAEATAPILATPTQASERPGGGNRP